MDERLAAKLERAYRRDAARVVRQTIVAAGVDRADAEDALHDAVLRWIEREQAGTADVPAQLGGLFLYRAARNNAREHRDRRRRWRRRLIEGGQYQMPPRRARVTRAADVPEIRRAWLAAILPEAQWAALEQRLAGRTMPDAAAALGLSMRQYRTALGNAHRRLRELAQRSKDEREVA